MASLNKLYTLHIPRTCSALRAWTSMQDKLKKCHLHSIYLQFPYLIYADFFVTKTTMQFFATKKICSHFFVANTGYAFFFAKTIYVLHPESFCALKVAIRKVRTFWASGFENWALVIKQFFFSEFKGKVWSRFWSSGKICMLILLLMFCRGYEVEYWLRFWR